MILWKRVALLGLLSWVIPLAISFVVFPLKQQNPPLFDTIMALIVLMTAGVLFRFYFRDRAVSRGEAGLVGLLWVVLNLVLDYPMFAYGPMKMTAAKYYSEIGLDYLIYPVFAFGAASLIGSRRAAQPPPA